MRRFLLVATQFPPLGGSGVQRILKWLRYLTPLGWEGDVLTLGRSHLPGYATDPSLLAEAPEGTRVFRVPFPDLAVWGLPFLRVPGVPGLLRQMLWPDDAALWIPPAVLVGRAWGRRRRYELVLSSQPGPSAHVVGGVLSCGLDLPWIADYRDEWSFHSELHPPTVRHARWHEAADRCVLRRANLVLGTSEKMTQALADFGGGAPGRYRTLTNGFDPCDLPRGLPRERDDVFRMAYGGSLYPLVHPDIFLDVVRRMVGDGQAPAGKVCVEFYGKRWGGAVSFAGLVRRHPYLPHREALRSLAAADVLFFCLHRRDVCIPAKTFEYLALGKPILAMAPPDGAAADLIRRTGGGVVVAPDDREGIARAILQFYRDWEAGRVWKGPDEATLRPYRREEQAKVLAGWMDELARRGTSR